MTAVCFVHFTRLNRKEGDVELFKNGNVRMRS